MIAEQIADRNKVAEVVSKALLRAADDLGLNGCYLAKIVGLSTATISRVRRGTCQISPETKPYEMAMMVIRIHQALAKIMSDDKAAMRSWMSSENQELKAVPAEKIKDIRGLVSVLVYTEMRASNV